MRILPFGLVLAVVLGLPESARGAEPRAPRVTRVLVKKGEHSLQLFDGADLVASYRVAIGPGGAGPKKKEGDMTTPVGRYHVIGHQPSQYRVFLRLDYPNAEDYRRFAAEKAKGNVPKDARIGGDIGIHGPPVSYPAEEKPALKQHDWTAGCIAVDDEEILELARRVKDGTPIDIED